MDKVFMTVGFLSTFIDPLEYSEIIGMRIKTKCGIPNELFYRRDK
jgi:hypothetical protein